MNGTDLEQYRALAEQAPSMVWRSGLGGKCDYCNATWLAFTGRALDAELEDGWTESVHAGDLQRYLAQFREHFERREGFEAELRLRRYDGVYRHVFLRAAPYQDPSGAFAGFLADGFDNSDVRELDVFSGGAEFFEMSLDLLSISGFDGFFKRVNPSWSKVLGWSAEELMARPVIDFVHPDDQQETLAGREGLKVNQPLIGLQNRYRCKDGSYRWFEWRSVGHIEREVVYGVARDITKQREAERVLKDAKELQERMQRQLILSDRLASVGMLAAGVAHEINNPLAYVMANLDLVAEELDRDEASETRPTAWREAVREAREGCDRIRKIVRGLKTLSRAEEERRSVIELRPVLELSVNMTLNEIRHRAQLVKDYGETPLVEADDARLGQVFINLIVNAAQAIPEGDSETNEIRIVTSTDSHGRAVIEVMDTGPGIPPEVLARVFDPFFTTKPIGVGTGLGLSICHSIVNGMGGEISASNREEGRGARLRVVLAAAEKRRPDAARVRDPELDGNAGRATVLVVDDERAVADTLGRVLTNHDVTAVTSAREALDLIFADRSFDLIISDLMMPGISGMEFYDTLVRERPHVAQRMVFMSGGAFTPTARAFLDRVPNERIEKPFNLSAVRKLVQKFVKSA